MKKIDITQQDILRDFDYDAVTGLVRARTTRGPNKTGKILGKEVFGYLLVEYKRRNLRLHHIAWMYICGYWPKLIDHIDGNKKNNAITNLREANHSENNCNRRKNKNKIGEYKGVKYRSDRSKPYSTQIRFNKQTYFLGSFYTAEEAACVYMAAAFDLHGDFAFDIENYT